MDHLFHKLAERVGSFAYVAVHKAKSFFSKLRHGKQKRLDYKLVGLAHNRRLPSIRQLRHIGRVLSSGELRIIKGALLVSLACLLVIGYNNLFRNIITLPAAGGEFTEGIVGAPLYVNPLFAQTNDVDLDISRLVFSGLLSYDEELELIPDLAESYSVSDDQKRYTFNLRRDVRWHDGKPFSATDVIFTFKSILDENYRSPLYRTFATVQVAQVDDYTVEFILTEPYAAFLHLMTTGIIPQHVWYDIPPVTAKLSNFNQKPIGTGPYKFARLVKEPTGMIRTYTLERNDSYYQTVPYIKRLTFKFFPDYRTAVDALINRSVDSLGFLPKDQYEKVAGKKRIALHDVPLSQLNGVFFNGDRADVLRDKTVRQALAYATDKQAIIEQAVRGFGVPATGPILPGFLGYAETKSYDYNPQKGAQILLDAGWKLDGETLVKGSTPLRFTLTVVDQGEFPRVAELLRQQWRQIGVAVDIDLVSRVQIEKDRIIPRNYQALLYGEVIGYDPDPYPYWHSSQRVHPGVNLTSYANRRTDELLEKARQTSDFDDRADAYVAFQGIIAEDVPALFLYSPTYIYPASTDLKGIHIERVASPSDRFIGIEQWYIKTIKRLK